MPKKITTKCPDCGQVQRIPEFYLNKNIKCSKCKTVFKAEKYTSPDVIQRPEQPYIPQTDTLPPAIESGVSEAMALIVGILMLLIGLGIATENTEAGAIVFVGGLLMLVSGKIIGSLREIYELLKNK